MIDRDWYEDNGDHFSPCNSPWPLPSAANVGKRSNLWTHRTHIKCILSNRSNNSKWIYAEKSEFSFWGEEAVLSCLVWGSPPPSLRWSDFCNHDDQHEQLTWTWRDFKDVDKQASIYQKKLLQVQRYHGARQKWRQVTKRELLSQIWTDTATCLTILAGRIL